ncbi:MAG: GHKL domain-containing protein [Oscillospiraceae bacterium]|nr:GHKL domain-containing protein [Oscillospiraceae bacterium]
MNGIDGIETAMKIRSKDKKAALIYISNYSEKMASSFAVHPFAFLEKPINSSDSKKVYFLLYDILIAVSAFAADIISTLCISVISDSTIEMTLQRQNMIIARYLLTCILTFIFCNLAFSIVKRKYTDIAWYEVIFYLMLAVGETMTASYIEKIIQNSSSGMFVILFLSGCFILDIYVVLMFYCLSRGRETEKENALLRQQSNLQIAVYRDLQQQYERSIINDALQKAEQKGIKIHLRIESMDLSFLSDIDLTTIISNLMDNALEAAEELPNNKKYIWFIMERKMGCCLIHSENAFDHIEKSSDRKFLSTKRGHMGIGLTNVKAAVLKYNGMFSAEIENEKFVVSITIPEKT